MNVAEQSQQILLLVADNPFVSAREKVADLALAAIAILGVGLLQRLHEFAQGSRAAFNEQVHVIGDQAIGVDFELIFRPVVLQTIKVGFVVVIAAKRPSLLIAAHDHQIQNSQVSPSDHHL